MSDLFTPILIWKGILPAFARWVSHAALATMMMRSRHALGRSIIPVHLYGLPAEMDAILHLADTHDLIFIEDACQAHDAYYKGRRVGSLGHASAFSFYPAKTLGGCGDGGMVVTDDAQVAERVRAMRNCGQKEKHHHHQLDVRDSEELLGRCLDMWR